jgi:hypothetical protein
VELRGLPAGTYSVRDYGYNKDLGTVQTDGNSPARLSAQFKDHLLLEVSK